MVIVFDKTQTLCLLVHPSVLSTTLKDSFNIDYQIYCLILTEYISTNNKIVIIREKK